MNISSGQKKLLLLGILVVAGAAAFVFFDPLELDLLGLNQKKPAAATKAPAQPAASPAQPQHRPASAPAATVNAAKAAANAGHGASAAAAVSAVAATAPASAVVAPVAARAEQTVQQVDKEPAENKPARKAARVRSSKDADLRDCLKLENTEAIVKCAEQ